MKHAVIAAILLLLIIIFIFCAARCVDDSCRALCDAAEKGTAELRAEFDARYRVLSLFIHNKLLEYAEQALIKLESSDIGSPEYVEAKELFLFYCDEMREDMSLSLDSIF